MATPLFDEIDIAISRRIGDPAASASTNGKVLTAAERNAYTNKALLEYFNRSWTALGGNIKEFLKIFPELLVVGQITTDSNGEFNIYGQPDNVLDYTTELVTDASHASSGSYGAIITDTGHGLTSADLDRIIVAWGTAVNIVVGRIKRIVDDNNFEIDQEFGGGVAGTLVYGVFTRSTSQNGWLAVLIDAYAIAASLQIKIMPGEHYTIIKNSLNGMYVPSSTNYFGFQIADYLKFLPASEFSQKAIEIQYIKQPLQSDGSLIAQGGSVDSPFRRHHNSAIAAIGEELIRIDRQYAR